MNASRGARCRASRSKTRPTRLRFTIGMRCRAKARVVHGNCVLNVVSQGAPHKGDALCALMAHSGCELSLYVGDDLTDEDVFRLRLPAVLSVGIDPKPDSAADLFLPHQDQIITLLDEIAGMIEG
jgi:trehalose 6-phosphate phosphatase